MNKHVPAEVYDNLVKLFQYRNCMMTSEVLSRQKVIEHLNHHEFIIMNGNRGPNDPRLAATIAYVLIASNSKYSNKSGDFKKLLRSLPKVKEGKLEVMFVSENELTIHIKKQLGLFRTENPNIFIENYTYSLFEIELPLHISVPNHTIADTTEVNNYCHKHYVLPEYFQKIDASDPPAVWIGLRAGMVCKIIRLSENAGTAPVYRFCVGKKE